MTGVTSVVILMLDHTMILFMIIIVVNENVDYGKILAQMNIAKTRNERPLRPPGIICHWDHITSSDRDTLLVNRLRYL